MKDSYMYLYSLSSLLCLCPFLAAIFQTTKTGFPCRLMTCFTGTVKVRVQILLSLSIYVIFFPFFCSWNIGPAHIISISTEFYFFYREYGSEQIANQYKWLEADLKVKIVFFRVFQNVKDLRHVCRTSHNMTCILPFH